MNFRNLFIPSELISLYYRLSKLKRRQIPGSEEFLIEVPEALLAELFIQSGAISGEDIRATRSKNEENESSDSDSLQSEDYKVVKSILPNEILEIKSNEGINLIRAIMIWKKLSLKEVANRYGGKSASANLANFLSKSDYELAHTRRSTLVKIARALEVSSDWLLPQ